jgi:hypothetical protein
MSHVLAAANPYVGSILINTPATNFSSYWSQPSPPVFFLKGVLEVALLFARASNLGGYNHTHGHLSTGYTKKYIR